MCVKNILDTGKPPIECYDVAIGKPSTPTPTGEFYFKRIVENPQYVSHLTGVNYGAGFLGEWAIETNLKGVDGAVVGIHGTNQESSIGQAVSGACIRLHNNNIREFVQNYAQGVIKGKIIE